MIPVYRSRCFLRRLVERFRSAQIDLSVSRMPGGELAWLEIRDVNPTR